MQDDDLLLFDNLYCKTHNIYMDTTNTNQIETADEIASFMAWVAEIESDWQDERINEIMSAGEQKGYNLAA